MDDVSESTQSLFEYGIQVGKLELNVAGVLAAILTLVAVWALSRLMQKGFTRYAMSHQPALRPAIYTVSRLAKYVLVVVGVLVAAGLMGIPLTQFAVLAGAVGVGLGFGLQAIFSNFVSGLILLFDRSLKVGDFVELESGVRGEVGDIGIRATRIMTNDNIDILVPNAEFVTGRVVNWTLGDNKIRLHVPFGVDYGVDKDLVKQAALEAAAEVPFTLDRSGTTQAASVAGGIRGEQPQLRAGRVADGGGDQATGRGQGRLHLGAGQRTPPKRHRHPIPDDRSQCSQPVRPRGTRSIARHARQASRSRAQRGGRSRAGCDAKPGLQRRARRSGIADCGEPHEDRSAHCCRIIASYVLNLSARRARAPPYGACK